MKIENYITIEQIKENISSIPVFNVEWNPSEISEWAFRALRKLSIPEDNILTSATFEVVDNKVYLPKHLQSIDLVKDPDTGLEFEELYSNEEIGNLQYKHINNYLVFDDNTKKVLVIFRTLPLDDEDQPLIPDNEYYISAIEAYIRYMLGVKGYNQRKIIINELQRLEQEWNYYLLATKAESKLQGGYNQRIHKIVKRHKIG